MITKLKQGNYRLIETKKHNKVLQLDDATYAWIEPPKIGEILVITHAAHKTDCLLSIGKYVLYEVDDEPSLVDVQHLELEVGNGQRQGYLLLTGLPDEEKKRARIIPTRDLINQI